AGVMWRFASSEQTYHVSVFQRLEHFPLTLFSSMPLSHIRAEWWERVRMPYLLLGLMLIGTGLIQMKSIKRQEAYEHLLNAELREARAEKRDARKADALATTLVPDSGKDAVVEPTLAF